MQVVDQQLLATNAPLVQGLLGGSPENQVVMPQTMMPPFGYNPNMPRRDMFAGLQGQDRRLLKDYIRSLPNDMRQPYPQMPIYTRPGQDSGVGNVNILPFPFPNAGMQKGGMKPGMQFMGGNPRVLPRGM